MRVIQTVNDTIRLLFNPKTEIFCLSDFLLVRDVDENFLGQVVEIYDDKFDQEANVAKIRLVYRIVNGGEVVPYDNYTPSRECEVAKIKQSEIEKCINLNKKTFEIGKNTKNGEITRINTDFFENRCIIFADKYEQTNRIFEALAPQFAKNRPVVILDFSGACNPQGAVSFVAGENFKMPLSSETIDYIQQKTLLHARIETQVVLGDVFSEMKNFLEESDENYIPLLRLIRVIQGQCKMTPSVELLVLISWLKKYLRAGIFARNKKEFEPVLKSFKKNKITSIDLSNIKGEWQKEFLDYITGQIKDEVYLLVRLNDNNINNDILNSIYLKRKNIAFIPSFSYGYKKAAHIMDFAQNYILMPTLNPKRDFTHANFQIEALSQNLFMLFGNETKDFIFVVESPAPSQKQASLRENDKMFISLNLQLEDMTPFELKPDNFTVKQSKPSSRRISEEIKLSDVLGTGGETRENVSSDTPPAAEIQEPPSKNEEVSGKNELSKLQEAETKDDLPSADKQKAAPDTALNTALNTDIGTGFEQEPEPVLEDTQEESVSPENVIDEDELDYFDVLTEEAALLAEDEPELPAEQADLKKEGTRLEEISQESAKTEIMDVAKVLAPEPVNNPKIADELVKSVEADTAKTGHAGLTGTDIAKKTQAGLVSAADNEAVAPEDKEIAPQNGENTPLPEAVLSEDEGSAPVNAGGLPVDISDTPLSSAERAELETALIYAEKNESAGEEAPQISLTLPDVTEKTNSGVEIAPAIEDIEAPKSENRTASRGGSKPLTSAQGISADVKSLTDNIDDLETSTVEKTKPARQNSETKAEKRGGAGLEGAPKIKENLSELPDIPPEFTEFAMSQQEDFTTVSPVKKSARKAAAESSEKPAKTSSRGAAKTPAKANAKVDTINTGTAPDTPDTKSAGETPAKKSTRKRTEQTPAQTAGFDDLLLLAAEEANSEENSLEETGHAVLDIVENVMQENDKSEEIPSAPERTEQKELPEKAEEIREGAANREISNEYEIERKFQEIINEEKTPNKSANSLQINERVSLDLDKIKREIKPDEPKLPIFDDDEQEGELILGGDFKEGSPVFHEKYGRGEVIKVIKYGSKCLLQIDFQDVGKRLLDPKIAKLQLAQEI